MATTFERITGPRADVNELEYVSALLQTGAKYTRKSGTVSSLDIRRYLRSRYGLDISVTDAQGIVSSLGGNSHPPDHVREMLIETKLVQEKARFSMMESSTSQMLSSVSKRSKQKSRINDTSEEGATNEISGKSNLEKSTVEELDTGSSTQKMTTSTSKIARTSMTGLATSVTTKNQAKKSKKMDNQLEKLQELMDEMKDPKMMYLDIVQITSMLLIPTIARYGKEWKDKNRFRMETEQSNEQIISNVGLKQRDQSDDNEDEIEVHRKFSKNDNDSINSNHQDNEEKSLAQVDPTGLLEFILQKLWKTARESEVSTGSSTFMSSTSLFEPPTLDKNLVEKLLVACNLHEWALNEDLMQRMVDVAKTPSGCFDAHSFVSALTTDLDAWDVGDEVKDSTYACDVFGPDGIDVFSRQHMRKTTLQEKEAKGNGNLKDRVDSQIDSKEQVQQENDETNRSVETQWKNDVLRVKMSRVIDFVVDAFNSFTGLIFIWGVYICFSGSYISLVLTLPAFQLQCDSTLSQGENFGCVLIITIINWLVLAILLVLFGMIVFIPLSLGNHSNSRSFLRQIVATFIAAVETILPGVLVFLWKKQPLDDPPTLAQQLVHSDSFMAALYTGMVAGSVLSLYYLFSALTMLREDKKLSLTQSSDERGTAMLKRACTRKISNMMHRAREMHTDIHEQDDVRSKDLTSSSKLDLSNQNDPVFQTFVLHGEGREECGSWSWVLRNLLSKSLFEVEGVWLPSRLWVFQCIQIVVLILYVILVQLGIETAVVNADEATAELPEDLPSWIYDLVPTGEDVRIACVPSAAISFVVMAMIILLYIPSSVSVILKYRCGMLKSLGSDEFQLYRVSMDTTYMNTANAVYGMLGAGGLFFAIFSLLIFLFLWDFSRPFMLTLLAWGIGLTITIVLKMIMTTFCRKRFFRAFYRHQPGKMNFSSLALECWFIGLGGGVLVGRITQFLLAAAFWIGRIDEPFLATNVGLLGYHFDYVPLHFRKELLVHEAHRHPYIERLGAMYLMRLRHKDFGCDANACWRQIFVLTLMPWLMKYHVNYEQRCSDSLKDQQVERDIEYEEQKDVGAVIADDVLKNVKDAGVGMYGIGEEGVKLAGVVTKAAVIDVPLQGLEKAGDVAQFAVP